MERNKRDKVGRGRDTGGKHGKKSEGGDVESREGGRVEKGRKEGMVG